MAYKEYSFVITANNSYPFVGGNWDKEALADRLNASPNVAVSVNNIINKNPTAFPPFHVHDKEAWVTARIGEPLYSKSKPKMEAKLRELANHKAIFNVNVSGLQEGKTPATSPTPLWLKASGVAIAGSVLVVFTGVLTDNLTGG